MKRQKRIICLCLILAMVITILPSEVKAQGKKTWGEAYEEVLKQYNSDSKAKLIYLNNDNIPEVFVRTEDRKDILISYYKGRVYENELHDQIDGGFSYVPKKSKISFTVLGAHGYVEIVAKLKKGQLNYIFVGNVADDVMNGGTYYAYVPTNKLFNAYSNDSWSLDVKFKGVSKSKYYKQMTKAGAVLKGKKLKDVATNDENGNHSQLSYLDTVRHQIKNLSGTNMDLNNDGKYENVRFIKKRDGHHLSILINGKKVLDKKGYYANAYLKQYDFSNNTYLCLKIMDEDDITRVFSFYQYKDGKFNKIYDLGKTFLRDGYGRKDAVKLKVKQEENHLLIESGWNTGITLGFVKTKYNVNYNQGKFKRESPIYDIVSYGSDKSVAPPYLSLKRNIKLYSSYDMKMQISDIKKGEKIRFTNVYMKGKDVFLKVMAESGVTGWFKVDLNKKYFSDKDLIIGG